MPVQFDDEEDTASSRDDPLYYTRVSTYSARGVQVLTLENGLGIRLENDEYLQAEGTWLSFDSKVSTASSRD